MERESNYDKFKQDALNRYITFDQDEIIKRLSLASDDTYIYLSFLQDNYRIHKTNPLIERICQAEDGTVSYADPNSNEVLSICDLLCHTKAPIQLSGNFKTLESLSRLQGGSAATLGEGFFFRSARLFDGRTKELTNACLKLKGNPTGKGDVAYQIPIYGDISLLVQFYESDDEFPATLNLYYDSDICNYLFYETLYYIADHVLQKLTSLL